MSASHDAPGPEVGAGAFIILTEQLITTDFIISRQPDQIKEGISKFMKNSYNVLDWSNCNDS
jgi:hypothetical protein